MTSGSTANLMAKARGNSSMLVKRKKSEDAYDEVPQDPRDKVRAKLPKPKVSSDASVHSPTTASQGGATVIG